MDYTEVLLNKLASNIASVRKNIDDACREAGRDPSSVTLIGVSKVFPVEYAEAAFMSGLKDLAENRVQELVPKTERFNELGLTPNWHLIGTLQRNKVKYIIGKTYLSYHPIDSESIKNELIDNIITLFLCGIGLFQSLVVSVESLSLVVIDLQGLGCSIGENLLAFCLFLGSGL